MKKYSVVAFACVALVLVTVLLIDGNVWPKTALALINGIVLGYSSGNLFKHLDGNILEKPRASANRKLVVVLVAMICEVVYAVAVGASMAIVPGLLLTMGLGGGAAALETKIWRKSDEG